MSPDLENELREFLKEHRESDTSRTLKRMLDELVSHEAKDEERHTESMGERRGISMRVAKLEEAVEALEAMKESA